ncbi:DNA-directed RNA polymerases I II and III subunit RPABC2-like [Sarcoptes scabiei]|nr:DNA-directed RNA polymerases I II and III subunit RPABC2-like [Sarcoptes scabiei]
MSLNSVRLLYLESLHSSRLMVDRARIKYKPDGNFGWIAVLGSLIISILADGYTYTAGQFYEQFLTVYGKSETITSIYIAIMTSSIFSISPFASGLIKVYGCRTVSIVGTILTIFGLGLSTVFDRSIYLHCFTLGFLAGCGLGFLFIAQVVIVTVWFDEKLGLATGLAECGSGFGMAIFALVIDHFIQVYSWKGAMIILCGLISTCLAISGLYAEPGCSDPNQDNRLATKKHFYMALREAVDFRLLRNDRHFLLLAISQAILSLVLFYPIIIISDRIKRSSSLYQNEKSTSIYVCFGIANGIGRILFGWISTSFEVNNLWLYISISFGLGFSIIITNLSTGMLSMQSFYCLIGIFYGGNICLTPVVLVNMLGHEQMANSFGIISFFNGIGALIGPPLLNSIVSPIEIENQKNFNGKVSQNDIYQTSIWIAGIINIFSAMILIPLPYLTANNDPNNPIGRKNRSIKSKILIEIEND